ncbi:NACHT and WD repeat domain-containing protein [Umezawaea endophytica]
MSSSGPAIGPRGVFAERFALLYAEAGDPPLKKVTESVTRARRTDEKDRPVRATAQRVSDWRRGRNVPARFAALSVVLEILIGEARKVRSTPAVPDLYDMAAWRALWEEAQASPVGVADSSYDDSHIGESGLCPYRGLAAFRPEDSGWFFGRERSTAALMSRLGNAADTSGIVMLVGASGAGKSSLMRAGMIPSIARGDLGVDGSAAWPVVLMTPGADPLKELAHQVPELSDALDLALDHDGLDHDVAAGLDSFINHTLMGIVRFSAQIRAAFAAYARDHGAERLVLVVDQFEEAFTLGGDETRLQLFVQALHAACTPTVPGGTPPVLVVLGVRADFYGRCLAYPELADALQNRQMVLGPMTSAELREAVSRPAKAAGLQLEPGLVELMLRDLGVRGGRPQGGQGAYDAGALPLLSHALLATWQRRQGGKLTISGYRAAGGIQGAVAATAERAWADLAPAAQRAARPLLLRLVRVGDDTQDTRRRSTRHELVEQAANRSAAEEALEVLARARLVTLDAGSVEITHEALLQAWPRLRVWVDQDREGALLRQRLEEDAGTWATEDKDSSLLYRGARLETARHWADGAGPGSLTATASAFLAVSGQQRKRSTWLRRAAVSVVVVLALIAVTAAVVAVRERDEAVFRGIVADANRLQDTDPSLSAQLDLVAHRMRPDDLDVYTRLVSTETSPLGIPLTGHTGAVYLTTFSPDSRTLATASYDNSVRLWDVADRRNPRLLGAPLLGHKSWVSSAVFSPDGKTLASAGDDGTVRLWDLSDLADPKPLGAPLEGGNGTIYLLAFSPDGKTLATANEDMTSRLWDVTDREHPKPLGAPLGNHTARVRSIAWDPTGRLFAAGGDDATIVLWNVADLTAPAMIGTLTGYDATVHSVAFSPDGRTLATGSDDRTVRLWNVADPTDPKLLGRPLTDHKGSVWTVAFSPDGRLLATGGADSTARLWNVTDPSQPQALGEPLTGRNGTVFAVGFSPDGRSLATGSADQTVRLWSLPPSVLVGQSGQTSAPTYSADGRLLITASEDRTIRLWDLSDRSAPRPLGPPVAAHDAAVWQLALSPDGRLLASGGEDRTVRLWDVSDPTRPRAVGTPLALQTRYTSLVGFSPDGRTLLTGNDDISLQLWDITDPERPRKLGDPITGAEGYVAYAEFTPDGRTLVTASADRGIRLYDVHDPNSVRPLGQVVPAHTAPIRDGAMTTDGRTLATTSDDKTIRLWDISDRSRVRQLGAPLTGHVESSVAVAFSPDGTRLASTSDDKTIRLWDVRDPARATPIGQSLTGHDAVVSDIVFSPDARSLASTSGDATVRLWDLDENQAITRICTNTRGVLTEELWRQYLPQLDYDPPCP